VPSLFSLRNAPVATCACPSPPPLFLSRSWPGSHPSASRPRPWTPDFSHHHGLGFLVGNVGECILCAHPLFLRFFPPPLFMPRSLYPPNRMPCAFPQVRRRCCLLMEVNPEHDRCPPMVGLLNTESLRAPRPHLLGFPIPPHWSTQVRCDPPMDGGVAKRIAR